MSDDADTFAIEDGPSHRSKYADALPQMIIAMIERVGGEVFLHDSEIHAAKGRKVALKISRDGAGVYLRVI